MEKINSYNFNVGSLKENNFGSKDSIGSIKNEEKNNTSFNASYCSNALDSSFGSFVMGRHIPMDNVIQNDTNDNSPKNGSMGGYSPARINLDASYSFNSVASSAQFSDASNSPKYSSAS
mmetsp:Transcript_13464/g.11529  ORF Transcript_13464/g.11529 Transcript_13464/m.11529 type:complete len:119 (-) Transcript_13464:485-841(-)|eukprot:CAMPEP_0114598142 /NCGR_PEP_ID=MMETSP0125-20121206/20477_1 /TAXON_ID=485358 ORGANISM="Aristerostoma sp., Strain ATCC 50986" /NCGR_SAMPLE_ID=MMETSP0125 /ASSEMBLY_ACC=CAM_ASM_000245 /LENGTH=118 /DNA_ID=CAMNT_0001803507 /DNA_START=1351 /DNA_END=1707 /DNA_ORIENTATION=-